MSFTPGSWKFKYHMNIDGVVIMEAEFDVTAKDLNIIAAAPEMKVWIEEMREAIIEGNSDAITLLLATGRSLLRHIEGEEDHND